MRNLPRVARVPDTLGVGLFGELKYKRKLRGPRIDCGLSAPKSTLERMVVAYLSLLSQLQAVLIAADRLEAEIDSPTHLFQR